MHVKQLLPGLAGKILILLLQVNTRIYLFFLSVGHRGRVKKEEKRKLKFGENDVFKCKVVCGGPFCAGTEPSMCKLRMGPPCVGHRQLCITILVLIFLMFELLYLFVLFCMFCFLNLSKILKIKKGKLIIKWALKSLNNLNLYKF